MAKVCIASENGTNTSVLLGLFSVLLLTSSFILIGVIAFPHVSNLKSFNVLAKKSLNHYNYIIQAQETLDIAKEIDFRDKMRIFIDKWMDMPLIGHHYIPQTPRL